MARADRRPSQPDRRATGAETTEFRAAFSEATDRLLLRRLRLFVLGWGAVLLAYAALDTLAEYGLIELYDLDPSADAAPTEGAGAWAPWRHMAYWSAVGAWLVGYLSALAATFRTGWLSRARASVISQALVTLDGMLAVVFVASEIVGPWYVVTFAATHVVASLVFPWSPRQAVRPAAAVLLGNALASLWALGPSQGLMVWLVITPVLALPGVFICWMRHSRRMERFSYNFMRSRYGTLRQELAYARSVHESLFPQPRTTGPVRFSYRYEPMRQIGGDFLHVTSTAAARPDAGALSVVILDVTGHGVPAALTVNRLHGEIELYFADNPGIGPGEVLKRLNRYVHLTLSKHSLFATAICVRIDPERGVVEHASAGHPPAFLLSADGMVDDLGATGLVLGASDSEDLAPKEESRPFGPHDTLIAYTDGVTEARDVGGRMLRIDGLRGLVKASAGMAHGDRAARLFEQVALHRGHRPAEDDTLIVEVYRAADAVERVSVASDGPGGAVVRT